MKQLKNWYTCCAVFGAGEVYATRTSVNMTPTEARETMRRNGGLWVLNKDYKPLNLMVPHELGRTPNEVNRTYKLRLTGREQLRREAA